MNVKRAGGPMRVKTSITLPKDLLEEIDHLEKNRSAWLERAARQYLAGIARDHRTAKDVALLKKHADRLNAEAADVLGYQGLPE